jgi:YegS/Rv2252/BmrU family lipid kinase
MHAAFFGDERMKKMLFILNPYAGQRKANRQLTEIIEIFNRADYAVNVYVTACQGDAYEMARRCADSVDIIACCGGDGTFNETAAGVLASGINVPVGYIPAGSTNDFANSLKLPTDILQAAHVITGGNVRQLDIGSFSGRYFSYVASFGAFTRASYATPQSVKNALGHVAYLLSGIQELSQIKARPLRFELPDGRVFEDKYIFGAISNSTSVAGILTLAPDRVDMSDGKLELMLVRAPKDAIELADCLVALQRQTYNCAMMTFLSTESLKITAPGDMDWTIDGEQEPGKESIQVECLQHALRVVC